MLALTVLLTGLAALYSAAMVGVIGYTEEELISSFLEDDMGLCGFADRTRRYRNRAAAR